MQMYNIYREKLLNAIIYFTKSVKNPSKVKIFKLLFFLDFQHFKETGRSVTNLDYHALPFGPVPMSLYDEINSNKVPDDFSKQLSLIPFKSEESGKKGAMFALKGKVKPDLTVFSPREKRILENLSFIFKEVDAKMISDVSHFKNHPWDRTVSEKRLKAKIDYLFALDEDAKVSLEEALDAMREREEMIRAFPPYPVIS